MIRSSRRGRDPVRERLASLGFVAEGPGRAFRRGDLALRPRDRWWTLETEGGGAPEGPRQEETHLAGIVRPALLLDSGRPGLWKRIRRDGQVRSVFDLPRLPLASSPDTTCEKPESINQEDPTAASEDVRLRLLPWAIATSEGRLPVDWSPPAREEVEAICRPERLALRAGPFAAQGVIQLATNRLAIAFPGFARIPGEISDSRRSWLEELLLDAAARWRLVRIGLDPGARSVGAEIDLSGAPDEAIEPLLRLSLDAIRFVVAWILPSLSLVLDPSVPCRALDLVDASRARPAERTVSHVR